MSNWRLCKSLDTLLTQVNALYTTRDKESDGSIGNAEHSARKSDHNPNAVGVVTAIDIDADLSSSENVGVIVNALRASKDPRIKYIIWRGQITMPGDLSRLQAYTGPNGHFHHMHISVSSNPALYDDARAWKLSTATVSNALDTNAEASPSVITAKSSPSILKRGSKGQEVRNLQKALGITIDGDYGNDTYYAVMRFQREKNIYVDGRVGPETKKELGL